MSSSSSGDLEPVFAAMLENAARICDANFGNIFRWDGDALCARRDPQYTACLYRTSQASAVSSEPRKSYWRHVKNERGNHVPI